MTEQGQVYADFIAEEVQRELSRRDGINAQATALLAGTGGMLTVTVAVVALVRRPSAIGSLTVTLLAMAVVGYLFGRPWLCSQQSRSVTASAQVKPWFGWSPTTGRTAASRLATSPRA